MIIEFLWTWLMVLGWVVGIVILSCLLLGLLFVGELLGGTIGFLIVAVVLITGIIAFVETLD